MSALGHVEKVGLEACTGVDNAAAAKLGRWKALKYADLQDTRVTPAGVGAPRAKKPGLIVLK